VKELAEELYFSLQPKKESINNILHNTYSTIKVTANELTFTLILSATFSKYCLFALLTLSGLRH
jgi:hypothetical protein